MEKWQFALKAVSRRNVLLKITDLSLGCLFIEEAPYVIIQNHYNNCATCPGQKDCAKWGYIKPMMREVWMKQMLKEKDFLSSYINGLRFKCLHRVDLIYILKQIHA